MLKLWNSVPILVLLFTTLYSCPPLYEQDKRNDILCRICPTGKVKTTYRKEDCMWYNRETFGYTWSEIHHAIYQATYALRDLLPHTMGKVKHAS